MLIRKRNLFRLKVAKKIVNGYQQLAHRKHPPSVITWPTLTSKLLDMFNSSDSCLLMH